MIDYKTIAVRLDKLNEYVKFLKAHQDISVKTLTKDFTLQAAICRCFQLAAECVIDIGELLISSLGLRKPKDAKEVIIILGEKKIIPANFAKKLAPVASFRNILVHEYINIDLKKVRRHLKEDLSDFNFFAKCVVKFLKTKQNKTKQKKRKEKAKSII